MLAVPAADRHQVVAANAWGSGLRLVPSVVSAQSASAVPLEGEYIEAMQSMPLPPKMVGLSYRAASQSEKTLTDWNPSIRSADGHILPEKQRIDARTADLIRNNGFAAGALETQKDNILGPRGLFLSCEPNAKALGWKDEFADEWSENTETEYASWRNDPLEFDYRGVCDGVDAGEIAFRGSFAAGDYFALPFWKDEPNRRWKTRVMLVDANRVRNPPGVPDSKNYRRGIKLDDQGRPIAVCVTKHTPGDYLIGSMSLNSYDVDEVPLFTEWGRRQAIQLIRRTDAAQNRGIGALAPVLATFQNLGFATSNELQNQVLNTMIGMVIETPVEDLFSLFENKEQYFEELGKRTPPNFKGAGQVVFLNPGEKMSQYSPSRPGAQLEQTFSVFFDELHALTGLPRELFQKDFSKSSYVGIRAGLAEAYRTFTSSRVWFATGWEQMLYELWLEEAVNNGRVRAPQFYKQRHLYTAADWIGAGLSYTDRVKEVTAASLSLENNMSTLKIECAIAGLHWRKVIEQRKREKRYIENAGLEFLPGRATVAAAGAPQIQNDGDNPPPQKKPTDSTKSPALSP